MGVLRKAAETIGGLGVLLIMLAYSCGAVSGAVVAVRRNSAINVGASLVIPFYGAGYTVYHLVHEDPPPMWIVLAFKTESGQTAAASLGPTKLTREACEAEVKENEQRFIHQARMMDPVIYKSQFSESRCIESYEDPVKRMQKEDASEKAEPANDSNQHRA